MTQHFFVPSFAPKNEVLRIEQMDNGGCVLMVHKKDGYPVNDRDRCAFSSMTDVIKALITSFPDSADEIRSYLDENFGVPPPEPDLHGALGHPSKIQDS